MLPFQNQEGNPTYQPQQAEVVVQIARVVQDGRLTPLETQQITDAGVAFGLSLIMGTFLGVLMRSAIAGVLEPEEEKAIRPAVDFILPDAKAPSYVPLVIKCAWCGRYLGEKEPYEDQSVTHGICPECWAKYFPKKKDDPHQTNHLEKRRTGEDCKWLLT